MEQLQIIIELSVRESYHKNLVHATLGLGDLYFIYVFVISKGFLKLLTIKINGKIRRFAVLRSLSSEAKNIMVDIYIDMHVRSIKNFKNL